MEERRRRNNDKKEKRKKNYKRLSNKLESATDKAKKEYSYLESLCDEIMELERTGYYDLLFMNTKERGWEDNRGNQNNSIETLKGR
jgi:hypothetical protein